MRTIKNLAIAIALLCASIGLAGVPTAYAACQDSAKAAIQCGVNNANGGASQSPDQAAGDLNSLLSRILNIFSVVVGIIAVIMLMIAGFRYITSGGSSEKVTGAKNTILYAVIGLVIVAIAQVIVKFVLNEATKVTP